MARRTEWITLYAVKLPEGIEFGEMLLIAVCNSLQNVLLSSALVGVSSPTFACSFSEFLVFHLQNLEAAYGKHEPIAIPDGFETRPSIYPKTWW